MSTDKISSPHMRGAYFYHYLEHSFPTAFRGRSNAAIFSLRFCRFFLRRLYALAVLHLVHFLGDILPIILQALQRTL